MNRTNQFAILLLVLLAIPSVLASSGTGYYFVVKSTAPSTDVLTGVNFAASMKGSVAVTFNSALDNAPADAIVAIYVDGKSVRIVGKGEVADAAKIYFERQGFSVESSQRTNIEPPDADPVIEDDEDYGSPGRDDGSADTAEEETKTTDNEADDSAPATIETASSSGQGASEEATTVKPSFFARIGIWFKGLFG